MTVIDHKYFSLTKQPTFGDTTTDFLQKDVSEMNAEIPHWWHVTTQIWEIWFNQKIITSTT